MESCGSFLYLVRADFVRRITVSHDSVRPDNDSRYLPGLHERRDHVVAYEGTGDFLVDQLVGSQPCALVVWPGLGAVHVL